MRISRSVTFALRSFKTASILKLTPTISRILAWASAARAAAATSAESGSPYLSAATAEMDHMQSELAKRPKRRNMVVPSTVGDRDVVERRGEWHVERHRSHLGRRR